MKFTILEAHDSVPNITEPKDLDSYNLSQLIKAVSEIGEDQRFEIRLLKKGIKPPEKSSILGHKINIRITPSGSSSYKDTIKTLPKKYSTIGKGRTKIWNIASGRSDDPESFGADKAWKIINAAQSEFVKYVTNQFAKLGARVILNPLELLYTGKGETLYEFHFFVADILHVFELFETGGLDRHMMLTPGLPLIQAPIGKQPKPKPGKTSTPPKSRLFDVDVESVVRKAIKVAGLKPVDKHVLNFHGNDMDVIPDEMDSEEITEVQYYVSDTKFAQLKMAKKTSKRWGTGGFNSHEIQNFHNINTPKGDRSATKMWMAYETVKNPRIWRQIIQADNSKFGLPARRKIMQVIDAFDAYSNVAVAAEIIPEKSKFINRNYGADSKKLKTLGKGKVIYYFFT